MKNFVNLIHLNFYYLILIFVLIHIQVLIFLRLLIEIHFLNFYN